MNKINKLMKDIEYINLQKEEAKRKIKKFDSQCRLKFSEIAQSYQDFYMQKNNKEFVLYENFPNMKALEIYLSLNLNNFPLYEYGELNIKELVEIIKYLYQFRTDKEYHILTIGAVELCYDAWRKSIPHLYFLVGNDKTLEPFEEYNGKFINSNKLYLNVFCNARGQNIINIEAKEDYSNSIEIECLTRNETDVLGSINYYDGYYGQYDSFEVSEKKQIFSSNMRSSLNFSGGYKVKGIKDVMDFNIHPFDSFIAKVLISIIIYKRNNNIQEFSNDDYNHIFEVLYGEKVDIIGDSQKDFTRKLLYVPPRKGL